MSELLSKQTGRKALLLGNEALVRGTLEAGLAFASCYPGTPSSEVPNTLFAIKDEAGLHMEFATNEKVAMEAAGAAAIAGIRSLTSMKHVGMNVAADPMMTLAYTGVRAGMVIYNADDPGMHSSQNEQDNRYFAKASGLPMLEPADAQEMKSMTCYAFELSERLGIPVIVRSTTRVAHSRGIVEFGALSKAVRKVAFVKDPCRLNALPVNTKAMHERLLEKLATAEKIANDTPFNKVNGRGGKWGVICSGVSRAYCLDAVAELGLQNKVGILELGMSHPLPERLVLDFLKQKTKVLVLEELEPFIEEAVRVVAQKKQLSCEIAGKGVGGLSRLSEYDPAMVRESVSIYFEVQNSPPKPLVLSDRPVLPMRPPNLCPGCPHRMTYYAVKKASDKSVIYANDIGCYTLGFFPPYQTADSTICMGASVSMPAGYATATDQKIISFIGDSTFFHSGITGLAHAVFNKHKFVLVILDNGITAMTGHQPSPASDPDMMGTTMAHLSIEDVVKGLGVSHIQVIKPNNLKKARAVFEAALAYDGLSVIISRGICPLHERKFIKKNKPVFQIDQEKCLLHRHCITEFACPAFMVQEGRIDINPALCVGCAACAQICTEGAIRLQKN